MYMRGISDETWCVYDDHRVMKIGSWFQVLHTCIKGRAQPQVLFYERLENDEEKERAKRQHSLNEALTDLQWMELRQYARQIDEDIRKINEE